jgi:class 3 adenylate cyclase/tetratricopeptide (TPR) repeat protein
MKAFQPERRRAAILFADVVGYSRLVEADETGTLAAIKDLRDTLLRPLLAEHCGRLVKLMGDGLIAEFSSIVGAVACAAAVQTQIASCQEKVTSERRIVLRIGVNLGDVVVEGDDLLGHGVNVAARLEQLCPPGGVLISGAAHDHISGKLDVRFEYAGEQRLKNIARPIRTYQLAGLNPAAPMLFSSPPDRRPLVAVKRFNSDVKQQDVPEAIVTKLSQFHSLHVTDMGAVGRGLDVRFWVKGHIQRSGDALRITAKLVDTRTSHVLWAEQYERGLEEIFLVQGELAGAIAATVEGRIAASGAELARRKPAQDRDASDLLQLGRECVSRYQAFAAKQFLEQAIRMDPNCAQAHALLTLACVFMFFHKGRTEYLDHAQYHAERAVQLDHADAESILSLGLALMHKKRLDEAGRHIERAIAMNPSDTMASAVYGLWLALMGNPKDALQSINAVLERDRFPLPFYWEFLGVALFVAERYEEAIHAFNHMEQLQWWTKGYRLASFALLGSREQARFYAAELLSQKQDFSVIDVQRTEPYKSRHDLQRLQEGIQMAIAA